MNLIVFQHLEVEHPGTFRDFWREANVTWTTIRLDAGQPIPHSLDDYDAMVVMGGPMDVWQTEANPWLTAEIAAIRHFVCDLKKPYLGVCLGHQLLGAALRSPIVPAASSEVGPCHVDITADGFRDPLFEDLSTPLLVFQWHSAEIEVLPDGAVCLARSDLCGIQAMRWGRSAYGIQFHAELTETTVAEWQGIPEYDRSLIEALGERRARALEAETAALLPLFDRTARRLTENFLRLARG